MTNPHLAQAREYAKWLTDRNPEREDARAAAEVIQSLPDQWVDAERLREILAEQYMKIEGNDRKWINAATIESLLTPPLPTLADMTNEERKACQWMQADHAEVGRIILTQIEPTGQTYLQPNGAAGWSNLDERKKITPRPDLPRLKWPGTEPAETETAVDDLAHAIRLTVEYTGNDLLPAIPGWSWFDALMKHRPDLAQPFIDKPITSPEPADLPRPEDVPELGEAWLVDYGDGQTVAILGKVDPTDDEPTWFTGDGAGYSLDWGKPVSRLVPEVTP